MCCSFVLPTSKMSIASFFTPAPGETSGAGEKSQCLICGAIFLKKNRARHLTEKHAAVLGRDVTRPPRGGPRPLGSSSARSLPDNALLHRNRSSPTVVSAWTTGSHVPSASSIASGRSSSSGSGTGLVESDVRRTAQVMLSQCKNYSTARLAEVAAAILPGASDDFIRSAVWLVDEAARFVTATVRRCQTAELNKNDSDAYRVHRSIIDTWSQGIDNPLDERFAFPAIAAPVRATGPISCEAAPSSLQAVQAWRVASAHQVQPPLSLASSPTRVPETPSSQWNLADGIGGRVYSPTGGQVSAYSPPPFGPFPSTATSPPDYRPSSFQEAGDDFSNTDLFSDPDTLWSAPAQRAQKPTVGMTTNAATTSSGQGHQTGAGPDITAPLSAPPADNLANADLLLEADETWMSGSSTSSVQSIQSEPHTATLKSVVCVPFKKSGATQRKKKPNQEEKGQEEKKMKRREKTTMKPDGCHHST